ncbi:MAG: adenine-specific methyltransferase EcoRI family protein [Treponema sp.]|nr:adenine-specific methyltransferase EcoRI family protein [Treponema sp.]
MASKFQKEAKIVKNDEFYTQFHDIEKEMNAYLEYNPDVFRGKTILLPCDDPYESNFFKYFALRFKDFGLKKLIATCYDGSQISNKELSLFNDETSENKTTRKAHKLVLTDPPDFNGIATVNLPNVKEILSDKQHLIRLKGNGDFRSDEVKALREETDFIITNPPFSLFREFLAWIVEASKKFIIIGNINAITYKEVFPLIRSIKVWLGPSITSGDREFIIPANIVDKEKFTGEIRKNEKGENIYYQKVVGVRWFTNVDHGRRHEPLSLMTMADNIRYSKHKELRGKEYQKYDNYNAIEVPYVDAIPSDYDGVMGVPVSLLDKYCPEQFEILGMSSSAGYNAEIVGLPFLGSKDARPLINGKNIYARIFIKRKGKPK